MRDGVPYSIYEAMRRGLVPVAYVPKAVEIVEYLMNRSPSPPPPPLSDPSWMNNNDPGWDNALRALEEDR